MVPANVGRRQDTSAQSGSNCRGVNTSERWGTRAAALVARKATLVGRGRSGPPCRERVAALPLRGDQRRSSRNSGDSLSKIFAAGASPGSRAVLELRKLEVLGLGPDFEGDFLAACPKLFDVGGDRFASVPQRLVTAIPLRQAARGEPERSRRIRRLSPSRGPPCSRASPNPPAPTISASACSGLRQTGVPGMLGRSLRRGVPKLRSRQEATVELRIGVLQLLRSPGFRGVSPTCAAGGLAPAPAGAGVRAPVEAARAGLGPGVVCSKRCGFPHLSIASSRET